MQPQRSPDFFDKARLIAVAGMTLAALCAFAGTLLDWVTITPPPRLPAAEAPKAQPFAGTDVAPDGWVVLGGGVMMLFAAAFLHASKRARWGWLSFMAAIVVGVIGVSRYREIGDISSGLSRQMDVVGDADPAIGIVLVAAAGVIGIIAAVVGVAASPRPPDPERG